MEELYPDQVLTKRSVTALIVNFSILAISLIFITKKRKNEKKKEKKYTNFMFTIYPQHKNKKKEIKGTLILAVYRLVILVFQVVTVLLAHQKTRSNNETMFEHYKFLTNTSFALYLVANLVAFFGTLLTWFYLQFCKGEWELSIFSIESLNQWNRVALILFEVTSVVNFMVFILYMGVELPSDIAKGKDIYSYLNYSRHFLNFVFSAIEFVMLMYVDFDYSHFHFILIYVVTYFNWAILLAKSKIIEELPYGGKISIDQNNASFVLKYGSLFVGCMVFVLFTFLSKKKKKSHVFQNAKIL